MKKMIIVFTVCFLVTARLSYGQVITRKMSNGNLNKAKTIPTLSKTILLLNDPWFDGPGYPQGDKGLVIAYDILSGDVLFEKAGDRDNHLTYAYSTDVLADVNYDGYEDALVPVQVIQPEKKDYVNLISGKDGAIHCVADLTGYENPYGIRLAAAGDYNLDGVEDFVVTGFDSDSNTCSIIFSGADCEKVKEFTIDHFIDEAIARSVGDINGDEVPELIVAEPYPSVNGAVYLLDGESTDIINAFEGTHYHGGFGVEIESGCDVNGDNKNDIAVRSRSNGNGGFSVYVYSGDVEENNELIHQFDVPFDHSYGFSFFGLDLADINKDGFCDVIFSDPSFAIAGDVGTRGKIYVYSGLNAELLLSYEGNEGDGIGMGCSATVDIDSDGKRDIAINISNEKAIIISGEDGAEAASFIPTAQYMAIRKIMAK